jgi:hypothetical protein
MRQAEDLTSHPERLAALCVLWRRERREVRLTLQGSSMWPTIPPGSSVHVDCGNQEYAPGTILAVLAQDRLIIHRLVRVDNADTPEPGLVCQGDANHFLDAPVSRAQILGVVTEHCPPPRLHRWLHALRTRWGRFRRLP